VTFSCAFFKSLSFLTDNLGAKEAITPLTHLLILNGVPASIVNVDTFAVLVEHFSVFGFPLRFHSICFYAVKLSKFLKSAYLHTEHIILLCLGNSTYKLPLLNGTIMVFHVNLFIIIVTLPFPFKLVSKHIFLDLTICGVEAVNKMHYSSKFYMRTH